MYQSKFCADLFLSIVLLFTLFCKLSSAISPFISQYQELDYSAHQVKTRFKRAIEDGTHVEKGVPLKFNAFGRDFRLKLFPDRSIFSNDHVITGSRGEIVSHDISNLFYEGRIIGEKNSLVHGAIRDGIFDGKIYLSNDTFIVEPIRRYKSKHKANVHSIIYSERHVIDPNSNKTYHNADINNNNNSLSNSSSTKGACAMTDNLLNEMEQVQRSALVDENSSSSASFCDMPSPLLANNTSCLHTHSRNKRSSNRQKSYSQSLADKKRVCRMYIQTDSFLWDHVMQSEKTPPRARDEILTMIAGHVKAISAIYQHYDFNGIRGIKFAVQRTTINDTNYCRENRLKDPFCKRNVDVSNLLSYNSLANHSDFCLAYLFTYRDFSGGTLGLAWVASPNGPSGGICEKYKLFSETRDGVRIKGWKSLNTGVITFVNYGNRVPPTVSHLTLAHEVGHNFGAPHDPAGCQPNGAKGNYIMYPSATSGDKDNNRKFSSCSKEKMSSVVSAVVNELNGKRNCFAATDEAFCGNKITEEGEVCDCGYNAAECVPDKCCYPAVMEDEHFREQGQACTLRRKINGRTVACSPSQGPCCSGGCGFLGREVKCRERTECAEEAYCSGKNADCSAAKAKPDRTLCAENTRVCLDGKCQGSICLLKDLEECFLTEDMVPSGVKGQEMMCYVACQDKNKTGTCRSTYDSGLVFPKHMLPDDFHDMHLANNQSGVLLRPGSPCNNYRGYCDIFHRCRRVDAEGPLETITKYLFNRQTLKSITQWLRDNWWEAALVLLAVVLFMACFIKCCAVHTPSSNPKRKKHRTLHDDWETLSTTLRRRPRNSRRNGNNGQRRRRNGRSDNNDRSNPDRVRGRREQRERDRRSRNNATSNNDRSDSDRRRNAAGSAAPLPTAPTIDDSELVATSGGQGSGQTAFVIGDSNSSASPLVVRTGALPDSPPPSYREAVGKKTLPSSDNSSASDRVPLVESSSSVMLQNMPNSSASASSSIQQRPLPPLPAGPGNSSLAHAPASVAAALFSAGGAMSRQNASRHSGGEVSGLPPAGHRKYRRSKSSPNNVGEKGKKKSSSSSAATSGKKSDKETNGARKKRRAK